MTSACFPFSRAFHAALKAQTWDCLTGSSFTREEIVEQFADIFTLEVEATPNLLYKKGKSFDSIAGPRRADA